MKQELKEIREILEMHRLSVGIDLMDKVEDSLQELVDEVSSLKSELDDANTEINNLQEAEPEYDNSIDLGLDTIHFTFEKDNLQIRQQFDSLMQVLNKTPNAVI